MACDDLLRMIQGMQNFNTKEECTTIIEKNGDYLVELQQQQLAAGINKEGQERRDEYRPFTIKKKQESGVGLGAVTDHVTFFETGETYNDLIPVIEGDEYIVKTRNESYKFDKMMERYPEEDYGLDEKARQDFAENKLMPEFSEVYEQQTGIKIEV